ncbi:MAG: type IX secretion system sortase PorU [Lunatimonas sp.]|uniref:type IX secretion system sortase PorU n=1 Tax=Lunatimonas sp. TaxID=2060141 RepID=UPI00263B7429|nr:type IX secretion system sortase PorU [Lunatimonas sp.]MCC5938741.1 type IX secretion system sortase PorU [Lunatimonas sp.]
MPSNFNIWTSLATLTVWLSSVGTLSAQAFLITTEKEGIYKITQSKARSLGLGDLEEISVYGVNGMLPQRLDSAALDMLELPGQLINDALYYYLSGPDTFTWKEKTPDFQVNHYSEIQHFIITGKSPSPKRISASIHAGHTSDLHTNPSTPWYAMESYHQPAFNLLQSGRDWFGHRMFSGQTANITLPVHSAFDSEHHVLFSATLLAQSTSESQFTTALNGEAINESSIPSIPASTYGIKGREHTASERIVLQSASQLQVQFAFQTADRNGTGYLKHLWVGIPVNPSLVENLVLYRPRATSDITLEIPDNRRVWSLGTQVQEIEHAGTLRSEVSKIAWFDPRSVPEMTITRPVDLSLREETSFPELWIVTAPQLMTEANRLASFKNGSGISAKAVSIDAIFDSFGYGNPDPSALRNFLANQYHRGKSLQNVLLLGKGTFDFKQILGGEPSLVPTYSSRNSLNPLTTYSSDDYFGFLTFGDGEWEESNAGDHLMNIGVGRIPATSLEDARHAVDKIVHYSSWSGTEGDWKRRVLLMADDGDNNIHVHDAEAHASFLFRNHPEFIVDKLYLDRFEQLNTGSAQESPAARAFLHEWLKESGLLINYIGHGNETTLTAEGLFRVTDIADMPVSNRLPVFVTATCEFGRHDSPMIQSAAERLLLTPRKGAIALLTTGRPVFSSVNFLLNRAFIENMFSRPNGEYLSLGEIFRQTKNNSLSGSLNRNFSLLGDPSLKLSLPEYHMGELMLTDASMEVEVDTIRAMQQIRFRGTVVEPLSRAVGSGFDGTFDIRVLDKPLTLRTRGDESQPIDFLENSALLHRGVGKIEQGQFEGSFFVGKNINYQLGEGSIQLFGQATGTAGEMMGAMRVQVGGTYPTSLKDTEGPRIAVTYDRDNFLPSGKLSTTQVRLTVSFEDPSGINISPINLGQDLTLQLNHQAPLTLNHLFRSLDSGFERGALELVLTGLQEGENRIVLTAFDNLGNRTVKEIRLDVTGVHSIKILAASNYPNPASHQTAFQIWHNRPGETIGVVLQIFSIDGREIFSTERRFQNAGENIRGLDWIFSEGNAVFPIKGTYIYHLKLSSEEDRTSDQIGGKLLIK